MLFHKSPNGPSPYNNRGNVYYELGKYEAALKDYQNAILLNPAWGKPYSNRGIVYYAQEKYEEAVMEFTKALEKSNEQSGVYNLRGLAYEKLKIIAKAEKDFRMAIFHDPSNGEAYFNLGRIQLHKGELNSAIKSYQTSQDLGWKKAEAVLKVLRKKGLF